MKYVALLLGINVGRNRKVPMAQLKVVMEELGFKNVKTLLNSGNVVFESDTNNESSLKEKIEKELKKTFGFEVFIILVDIKQLQILVKKDPFKSIKVTLNTRLYITFLSEKLTSTLKIPYESPECNFRILEIRDNAVISVLEVSEDNKTTDAMSILGKEFGKKITTRNWNTVRKIVGL